MIDGLFDQPKYGFRDVYRKNIFALKNRYFSLFEQLIFFQNQASWGITLYLLFLEINKNIFHEQSRTDCKIGR